MQRSVWQERGGAEALERALPDLEAGRVTPYDVAALILRSAWFLLRRSGHILLEGAPEWLDEAELRDALVAAVPEVREVHHVHVWMLTTERPLITLHARVAPGVDQQEALHGIHRALAERFGIEHATVQIEIEGCPPTTAARASA